MGELEKFFRELRERTVAARLQERALPASLVKPFDFKRENVAPPEKVGGNLLGGIVPYIIIILCFTGAMYPAMDLTAGEKERGTMETLLCSPVARVNLVLGKFLMGADRFAGGDGALPDLDGRQRGGGRRCLCRQRGRGQGRCCG